MEAISGTHGIDDDIGERTRIEAFDLDMLAEGGEVAIDAAQLGGGAVRVLRWRLLNGRDFGFRMFAVLRLLHVASLTPPPSSSALRNYVQFIVFGRLAIVTLTATLRGDRTLFRGSH